MTDPVSRKNYDMPVDINRDGVPDLFRMIYPVGEMRIGFSDARGKPRRGDPVPAASEAVFVSLTDNPAVQIGLTNREPCDVETAKKRACEKSVANEPCMAGAWRFTDRRVRFCDQGKPPAEQHCFSVGEKVRHSGRLHVIRSFRVFIHAEAIIPDWRVFPDDKPTVTVSPAEAIFAGCRFAVLDDLTPVVPK